MGRINQLIGNAASQGIRSPLTVESENVAVDDGRWAAGDCAEGSQGD